MANRIEWRAPARFAALALVGAMALGGCPSRSTNPTKFSQADLAGDWDLVQISTNGGPRWYVASIAVAADGAVAVTSNLDSGGNNGLPGAGFDARIAVDASGTVGLGGADGNAAFHGTLSSSKSLVVATATESGGTGYSLVVIRKRVPGTAFGSADVSSFPFALQALRVGNAIGWQVGTGSTDASGRITVASLQDSAGTTCTTGVSPCPPAGFDTIQVDANGLVTTANDATFHGVMTPDKNAIFAVSTTAAAPPQTHQLLVILRASQTFAAADLAGEYALHSLASGATTGTSSWSRGAVTIDAAGQVTFTSYLTSGGGTSAPTGVAFTFDPATGIITWPANPTFHGRLAWGKDFYARIMGPATLPSLAVAAR